MLSRFWWGLSRPFVLLDRLRVEPIAWRAFRRTVGVQVLLTLCIGSAYTVWTGAAKETKDEELSEARSELAEAQAAFRDAGIVDDDGELEELKHTVEEQLRVVEKLERKESEPVRPLWAWLAVWASSLLGAQMVVLALTRDYQDRLARDLALVARLEPEDNPARMRVRVDLRWLWRKARRRVRGVWVTAAGVVALSPLIVIASLVGLGDLASSTVVTVVSAYWWVVFTASRSARAWQFEEDTTPPTPIRALGELATWRFLHWLGPLARFVRWATKSMAAPARAIEQDFAVFAGLGVARALASIPVVRIGLRAAVIVAAAEALEATAPVRLPVALPFDNQTKHH